MSGSSNLSWVSSILLQLSEVLSSHAVRCRSYAKYLAITRYAVTVIEVRNMIGVLISNVWMCFLYTILIYSLISRLVWRCSWLWPENCRSHMSCSRYPHRGSHRGSASRATSARSFISLGVWSACLEIAILRISRSSSGNVSGSYMFLGVDTFKQAWCSVASKVWPNDSIGMSSYWIACRLDSCTEKERAPGAGSSSHASSGPALAVLPPKPSLFREIAVTIASNGWPQWYCSKQRFRPSGGSSCW